MGPYDERHDVGRLDDGAGRGGMEWRGRRGWVDESKLMQGCFGGEGVFSSPDERLFRDHVGFCYLKPKYAGSWLDGVSASRAGIFCPFPIHGISKLPIFKNSPVSPPPHKTPLL